MTAAQRNRFFRERLTDVDSMVRLISVGRGHNNMTAHDSECSHKNMNNEKNISSSSHSAQNTMDSVKESAYKILDALEGGEKTTLKDLIDKIVAETKVQVSIANGLVPMVVHEWAKNGNGSVEKGRNGGVFKGGKPIRIDPRPRCTECGQVDRKKLSIKD